VKSTSLILIGALAGTVLLTGCGQEAALRPAASDAAGSSPSAGPSSAPSAVPTSEPTSEPAAPSTSPSPAVHRHPPTAAGTKQTGSRPTNALDWDKPAIVDEDLDHGVRFAWAAAHKVDPSRVVGEQLQLGLADGGELLVGAYQLWVPGGQAHVVVVQSEPRGEAVLVRDTVARPELGHVDGVVSRRAAFVVVATAPGTSRVEYRAGEAAGWKVIDQDSSGLIFARSATPAVGEALRLTRNGRATVSPVSKSLRDRTPAPQAAGPSNLLDWPARGIESTGPSVSTVAAAYAAAAKAPEVKVRRLFSGNTDAGLRYLIGQAWVPGKPAVTVAYVENPGREPELKIQPATPEGVRLVALLLTDQPGTTTDLLVVVPEPRTTQVSYRTSRTAPWKPAFTYSTLDGVAFVDRAKDAGDDALRLLTGNGDPAAGSTLVLPVSQALCNGAGCP